jgi:AAA family ATP:ADP antiporter
VSSGAAAAPPTPAGPLSRVLQRTVDVRPEEVRAALWSCAYFFFLLASYYILRPIRDQAGIAGGIRNLPWLFTGTMLAMLLVNPPFAALVSRLPRSRFVPLTYRFFLANLLVFFALFQTLPESSQVWVGRTFYIWTSVFNLFVVSIFWGFMADAFRSGQGKRLFGFIGVGGTLGGIVGSAVTASLVDGIGRPALLLVSAAMLELAVVCARRLSAGLGQLSEAAPERARQGETPIGGGLLAGITGVARSPYLLGICAYMLLYTLGSTFLYFQQAGIIERFFVDADAQTGMFARIDLYTNVATILIQIFLTGRIMKWIGVAATLTLVPALSVFGFLGLGLLPSVAMLVVFQVARRAGNYALARPSREVLYTVVSREDRFKAKSFIDTFVYRLGDQIGAWADPLLKAMGLGMTGIALVAAPLAGLWLVVGYWLGKRQAVKASVLEAAAPEVVAAPS